MHGLYTNDMTALHPDRVAYLDDYYGANDMDTKIPQDGYPDDNPKTFMGAQKPSIESIPQTAIVELGVRMGHGADKYGAFNWRHQPISSSVYIGAMGRHLAAFADGEYFDTDCPYGTSHLAAIMACAALLIDGFQSGRINDNRPPAAPSAEMIRYFEEHGRLPHPKGLKEGAR